MKLDPHKYEYLLAGLEDGHPVSMVTVLSGRLNRASDVVVTVTEYQKLKSCTLILQNIVFLRRRPWWERLRFSSPNPAA